MHSACTRSNRTVDGTVYAKKLANARETAQEVLLSARPARDALRVRVSRRVAGHPARRVGHEAGVGRVFAALREVAAQAGLEYSAGVALFVSAAACQVIPPDEFEHVGGELVEWDHGESGGIAVIAVISSGEKYE